MQTILKLIGEGGGYCIEGEQDGSGWRFRVARDPEVWRRSLQDVLSTINQGWPGLYPETIHPDFRAVVWELFCAADRHVREDRVLDWRERCIGYREDDCSDVQPSPGGLKECLRPAPHEVYQAALLLEDAATAHRRGDDDEAIRCIAAANMPVVREWTESLWGARSPHVFLTDSDIDIGKPGSAEGARMPTAVVQRQLHSRDGYHCRFCGVPVIRKEVRQRFCALFPALQIWGSRNVDQHAAFQAMWAQYDHLVPYSKGGSSELDNLVVTCAPCNFARMDYTLGQVGLADPRERTPPRSSWNGLENILL